MTTQREKDIAHYYSTGRSQDLETDYEGQAYAQGKADARKEIVARIRALEVGYYGELEGLDGLLKELQADE